MKTRHNGYELTEVPVFNQVEVLPVTRPEGVVIKFTNKEGVVSTYNLDQVEAAHSHLETIIYLARQVTTGASE